MTSSASALLDVLAAEGGGEDTGFHAPTVQEFYPEPLVSFALLGVDFEITRITLIMWIATALMIGLMVAAVRKPTIVPGKLQFLGESGYSVVRDGIARDVIGPKGLPFAPFLASLFFFILANNAMSIIPFAQISPNSKFALPLVLAVITWILYNYQGAKSQGLGHYVKGSLFPPGIPAPIYLLVTPIELISTFVLRPITLFIRLLANMIAGHLILGLFFSASTYLFLGFQDGRWWTAFFGLGSFLGAIVFTFFEALVAVLQAYIFTLLTAVYLAGSLEPEH